MAVNINRLIKNVRYGFFIKFFSVIFSFVNRTVFVQMLGEEVLGINGLFSNILAVLSLADLGISSVLMYELYEPVVKKEYDQINCLLRYFKKIYQGIAGGILVIGVGVMPLLPFLIKDTSYKFNVLAFWYVLFLLNTVCSYLAVYRSTLLLADQNNYLVNLIQFLSTIVKHVLQIVVLLYTKNFSLYLMVAILSTVLNNLWISEITCKKYPFLKGNYIETTQMGYKSQILQNIRAMFLYRASGTVLNSTDNILISVVINTIAVGLYSNYLMITSNILMLINVCSQSVMSTIGNYSVDAKKQDNEKFYKQIMLVYYWIAVIVFLGVNFFSSDFIHIWLGDTKYVLSEMFVIVISMKIFLDVAITPNWMFCEATGVFSKIKYVRFFTAVLNVGLSVLLGRKFGLEGILIATIISIMLTLFWYEPYVLFKHVFNDAFKNYAMYQTKLLFMSGTTLSLGVVLGRLIFHWDAPFGMKILYKVVCCMVLGIFFFGVLAMKTREGKHLLVKIKCIIFDKLKFDCKE